MSVNAPLYPGAVAAHHPHDCRCNCLPDRARVPAAILAMILAILVVPCVLGGAFGTYHEDDAVGSGTGSSGGNFVETNYWPQETRLLAVSSYFKEKVGVTVDNYLSSDADASLYLLKDPPPLTEKVNITGLTMDFMIHHVIHYWHFYLHPNSNVTFGGCVYNMFFLYNYCQRSPKLKKLEKFTQY